MVIVQIQIWIGYDIQYKYQAQDDFDRGMDGIYYITVNAEPDQAQENHPDNDPAGIMIHGIEQKVVDDVPADQVKDKRGGFNRFKIDCLPETAQSLNDRYKWIVQFFVPYDIKNNTD